MRVAVWVEKEVAVEVSIASVIEAIGTLPKTESQNELLGLLSTCLGRYPKSFSSV